MAGYITTSFHDLLEDPSSGGSSSETEHPRGEHVPHKCYVVDIIENVSGNGAKDNNLAPPQLMPAQQEAHLRECAKRLRSRRIDLEAERSQLECEQAEIKGRLGPQHDGGRACARARQVHQDTMQGAEDVPHFARANQNITTAAMILRAVCHASLSLSPKLGRVKNRAPECRIGFSPVKLRHPAAQFQFIGTFVKESPCFLAIFPSADDEAAAEEKLSYVLLEVEACVAECYNATTAYSKTCDGTWI
ncbi:hypothetical protein BAE44_0002354 [Dichanthelium oligosanthes]|uniref:Uncharacterized protein n=1 Tax=Dichanthelium oligosanthes TaxID=888268 RepID=A0A1E5WGV1_9POAL|nr:hypothetical protein BAE44_0002354 [Dichanthelium oligosanthes]